jgi:hypothetical protein
MGRSAVGQAPSGPRTPGTNAEGHPKVDRVAKVARGKGAGT